LQQISYLVRWLIRGDYSMKWLFSLLFCSFLSIATLRSVVDSPFSLVEENRSTKENRGNSVFKNGLLPLPDGNPVVLESLPLPKEPPPKPEAMPYPYKKSQYDSPEKHKHKKETPNKE
jgi:hypothetical protein